MLKKDNYCLNLQVHYLFAGAGSCLNIGENRIQYLRNNKSTPILGYHLICPGYFIRYSHLVCRYQREDTRIRTWAVQYSIHSLYSDTILPLIWVTRWWYYTGNVAQTICRPYFVKFDSVWNVWFSYFFGSSYIHRILPLHDSF